MSIAVLEYEEWLGRGWDRLVGGRHSLRHFPEAAVRLEDERRRLAVLFRALGGDPGLELVAGTPAGSGHRLNLAQRLGMSEERLDRAERTGELVLLPPMLDLLPTATLNRDLYVWLVAFLAGGEPPADSLDPLWRDIARLQAAAVRTTQLLNAFPGLRSRHAGLAAALLGLRPQRRLRPLEAAVEAAVRHLHGDMGATGPIVTRVQAPTPTLAGLAAPRGYRPFLPSPLWGILRGDEPAAASRPAAAEPGSDDDDRDAGRHHRARRRTAEEEHRREPLTLVNKGEHLLAASESVTMSRLEDDDDPQTARRAADDMEELALGGADERPAAKRTRLSLDLAAGAVDRTQVGSGPHTYPEWDFRRQAYRPACCTVLLATASGTGEDWAPSPALRRHIRLVRRRFEALRPRREVLRAQTDGDEIDMDALVRAHTDLAAGTVGSDRIHLAVRNRVRDLATTILVDTSFSTDGWVEGHRVLDVEKAALTALAFGLEACGDAFAISTFSSHRRDRVVVSTVKAFEERLDETVRRRIATLRPGAYTRTGAAMRHVATGLAKRPERHRLLLLLSDGKPNDIDHYEGRYAVEDCRKAVQEIRGQGLAVFAVTVDRRAEGYVPRIFGPGGYAMVGHLGRLADALPAIYRQLVS